eukprot:11816036-Alexandrium_andersonii.AAC.1
MALAPRSSEMGRWNPVKKRENYAKLRLREIQRAFPHLADDALSHVTLRQLSQALRRAGRNQSSLPRGERRDSGAAGAPAQPGARSASGGGPGADFAPGL